LHLSGLVLALTNLLAALARLLCLLARLVLLTLLATLSGLVLLTLLTALSGLVPLLVLLIILVRHERFLSGGRRKLQPGSDFFVPARRSYDYFAVELDDIGFCITANTRRVHRTRGIAQRNVVHNRLCPFVRGCCISDAPCESATLSSRNQGL
jgi:hypothetical protein